MQRAQRGVDNHAVDLAVKIANLLGLPLVVYFAGISNFPHANLRHYVFLNQGLPDIESDLAARNISFVMRRAPHESQERLLADVYAAFLIGDENPMRVPARCRILMFARRWSARFRKTSGRATSPPIPALLPMRMRRLGLSPGRT